MSELKLPPLSALLTFETAAQLGSFAKTAEQLCLTPAAISLQIKQLEQQLGVLLFTRAKQGVRLTAAGQSYLAFVSEALAKLRLGQQQLRPYQDPDVISISTLPSVASKWLMPKVLSWMLENPGIEVRVDASHKRVDFEHSAADLCISFGDQGYQEYLCQPLFRDQVFPVASPQLLQTGEHRLTPAQLVQLPMLHIDWGRDNVSLPSWRDWFKHCDVAALEPAKGAHFNLSSMAIDAAVLGQGVLLGQQGLIEGELQTGRLVRLSDTSLSLEQLYYLVCPTRSLEKPMVAELIDWLKRAAL